MRGGGDKEEIKKLQKQIQEGEEMDRLRAADTPPQEEGVVGTNYDPKYLKGLWGDYCHKHNKNETECTAARDFCSYKYYASNDKCTNNYGDLETAEGRIMGEKERQEEIVRLQKLIQDLERGG